MCFFSSIFITRYTSDTFCFMHVHHISIVIVGMGKEGRTLVGPWWYLKRQHTLRNWNYPEDQWPWASGHSVVNASLRN